MSKQSPIRYLAVTTNDGDKFTIRVTRDTSRAVFGIEVDRDGEEIVPQGFHNRTRVIERGAIRQAIEMRMNVTYGRMERAKARAVTHLRIDTGTIGSRGATLWCREHTEVSPGASTTEDPSKVTCKRCIAAGGCGPGWKS